LRWGEVHARLVGKNLEVVVDFLKVNMLSLYLQRKTKENNETSAKITANLAEISNEYLSQDSRLSQLRL
jgi:hypothetical protein